MKPYFYTPNGHVSLPDPSALLAFLSAASTGGFDQIGPFELWAVEHQQLVHNAGLAVLRERATAFREAAALEGSTSRIRALARALDDYAELDRRGQRMVSAMMRDTLAQMMMARPDFFEQINGSVPSSHGLAFMLALAAAPHGSPWELSVDVQKDVDAAVEAAGLHYAVSALRAHPDFRNFAWAAEYEMKARKGHPNARKLTKQEFATRALAQPGLGQSEQDRQTYQAAADTLSELRSAVVREVGWEPSERNMTTLLQRVSHDLAETLLLRPTRKKAGRKKK